MLYSSLLSLLLLGLGQSAAASPAGKSIAARQNVDCPVSPSTISDCTYFVCSVQGDSCASIASYWGITEAEFINYNPVVGSNCQNFAVDQGYCVEENYGRGPAPTTTSTPTTTSPTGPVTGAPSPTQTGLTSSCTRFYKVQPGDTCAGIVNMYNEFTLGDFYSWNPAVGTSCQDLLAGYYVCTAVPGTASTPITSKPTKTTGTGVSPTQSGIAPNCNNYYQVETGDTCQGIVDRYNGAFTLSQFYSWNPAVGSSCSQLIAGDYVCVGVKGGTTITKTTSTTGTSPTGPSPTQSGIVSNCNKYYQAKSGDTCDAIAAKFCTFTTSTFEKWNPAVGSSCTQLIAGDYYCVGIPSTPTTCVGSTTPKPTTTKTGGAPSPHQTGIASNCVKYYKAVSGDTCDGIAKKYCYFTAATFEKWNPAVGSGCNELLVGDYYCVETSGVATKCLSTAKPTSTHGPQPQQTGIPADCNKYHDVVSGDTCDKIESQYKITAAHFKSWNPAINGGCTNLLVGYYVCVGVS